MPIKLPPGISAGTHASAVREFQRVVGADWVFTSEEDLDTYRDAYSIRWGLEDEYFASAAVAPKSVEEVQAIVRIANKYRIPLYPISTGKNLTYGGSAPTYSGSVVLDLKRMNRVLEVDEKRGFALVEPGCSYFDLYRHVQERGLKVWIDCPDPGWGSPIGNALDHGVGYTASPFRDHWGSHCGVEVVTPTGEVMRTGMGASPTAKTWQEYKYGVGPHVDGLFAQANFGIVTKMGFWLFPQPEAWMTGTVNVPKYSDYVPLVEHCNYLEDAMIATGQTIYGTDYGGFGNPQLQAEIRALMANGWPSIAETDAFCEKKGLPAFRAKLQFYGPPEVIQARWEYAKERISKAIPGATYTNVEMLTIPLTPEQEKTHHLVNFGIPNMAIFAQMARAPGQADPKDGHTDFFAVVPRTGEAVFKAAKLAYDLQKELGDSPNNATPFRVPVTWHHRVFFMGAGGVDSQRSDPEFNRRMQERYHFFVKRFGEAGFPPYRTNPGAMDLLAAQYGFNDNVLLKFQEAMKDGIDPNGILAPGRYGIWPKRLRAKRA
jgi:hypothetical protein